MQQDQTPFDSIEAVQTADALIRRIQNAKHVVTERLHPAILAACFGIPFTYLQSTSKSRDLEYLLAEISPSLSSLFVDIRKKPSSLLESYTKSRQPHIPNDLIRAAREIKSRLQHAASRVAERIANRS